jgi:uncharacterized protein (DUF488 family)
MLSRQRAILRLLQNEGGSISRLRLVKLAFLLSRDPTAPKTAIYDFVPYKRGPFSFTLYHDLRSLQRDGWVVEGEHDITTAEAPDLEVAFLDREVLALIDGISKSHHPVSTAALVDNIYRKYPWFTLNSEAIRKRAVTRPVAIPAVYTVGYEGITVDGLLDLLLRNGMRRLIDVRCNPVARRYGFHKETLRRLCADVDIEYFHMAALGVPSAWRADLSDQASYARLFERYDNEILPAQAMAVDKAGALISEMPSALMCMEADQHSCHRSRLGSEIARKTSLPMKELREM